MIFRKDKSCPRKKLNILQTNKEKVMNNNELVSLFKEIDTNDNCFDRALALKNATKQYKKSDFYKQTKMSIYKAYKIYQLNSTYVVAALLNNPIVTSLARGDTLLLRLEIENLMADFDTTKLDNIFNYIEEKIDNLEIDTTKIGVELQGLVKEFKNSLTQ